jgi:hypothetical protein
VDLTADARFRRTTTAALLLLAVAYAVVLLVHASQSVAGSDSSGYFNLARAIASNRLVEPIEPLERLGFPPQDLHLFIPLGFVPGPRPGTMATFYPPGLPLQIVAASAIAGWRTGPFLLSPLFAAASVLLTYAVGRELGLRRVSCLGCAAALACLPVLNFQASQLMSDTAAIAWALAAVLFALRARQRPVWAAAAGAAFGLGVLVRPASAVLIFALAFALPFRPSAWLLFGAGGVPFAGYFAGFNRVSYGGSLRTGYGSGGALADFAWANFPPRFRHYLYWLGSQWTPLVPLCAFASVLDRLRPLRTRLLLACWFGAFFLLYCCYGPYETWWYTRYLLPAVPALLFGAAFVLEDFAAVAHASQRRAVRAAAAGLALLVFLAVCGRGLQLGRHFGVLDVGRGEAVYPETVRWAAARVPANAVIVAMQFSGAMKAYGWGTFIRWDYIDAERFPALRRQIEARGFRIYALVFPFEVRDAASRVPGNWTYLGSNRDAGLFRLDP